jgi:hypothetical protein
MNHDGLVRQIWGDSMLISAGRHARRIAAPLASLPCVVWLQVQDWVQISDSAAASDGWCLLPPATTGTSRGQGDRRRGSDGGGGERMEFMVLHRSGGGAGARIISGGASGDKRREFGAAGCRGGGAHGGGPHLWHSASSRLSPRTTKQPAPAAASSTGARSRRRVVHPLLHRGILRRGRDAITVTADALGQRVQADLFLLDRLTIARHGYLLQEHAACIRVLY